MHASVAPRHRRRGVAQCLPSQLRVPHRNIEANSAVRRGDLEWVRRRSMIGAWRGCMLMAAVNAFAITVFWFPGRLKIRCRVCRVVVLCTVEWRLCKHIAWSRRLDCRLALGGGGLCAASVCTERSSFWHCGMGSDLLPACVGGVARLTAAVGCGFGCAPHINLGHVGWRSRRCRAFPDS